MSTIERLPVITLIQPWASWIQFGWKTIETRTHQRFASLAGRECYIHAGAKWDSEAMNPSGVAFEQLTFEQYSHTINSVVLVRSMILCKVIFGAHRYMTLHDSRAALIDCGMASPQRWGLEIIARQDVVPNGDRFINVRGKQGIWYFP